MTFTGPLAAAAHYSRRTQSATCTITRPGDGEPVFDPETGTYTDPADVTVYTGSCLVLPTGGDRVQQFGEGPVVLRSFDVTLSGLDDGVEVGDSITVAHDTDPRLDGMALTVLDVQSSSLPTNRRLVAEEVL